MYVNLHVVQMNVSFFSRSNIKAFLADTSHKIDLSSNQSFIDKVLK